MRAIVSRFVVYKHAKERDTAVVPVFTPRPRLCDRRTTPDSLAKLAASRPVLEIEVAERLADSVMNRSR
jgi:hypothetical protein